MLDYVEDLLMFTLRNDDEFFVSMRGLQNLCDNDNILSEGDEAVELLLFLNKPKIPEALLFLLSSVVAVVAVEDMLY
jgi:hypothetical protein